MKRIWKFSFYVLVLLFDFYGEVHSETHDLKWTNGEIVVQGKAYNRQIYFRDGKRIHRLSRFAKWENIERLAISPDKKRLVVYHRSNREKFHRLSIFELEKRNNSFVSSTRPGMACFDLFWFDKTIVFETDATRLRNDF